MNHIPTYNIFVTLLDDRLCYVIRYQIMYYSLIMKRMVPFIIFSNYTILY